jgi:hypothetical protein
MCCAMWSSIAQTTRLQLGNHWGISSVGRASALQAEGRRFDPVILHHCFRVIMLRTKDKGDLSEVMAIAAFTTKRLSVSVPIGDNQRYDLLVDVRGKIKRVQVKTGRIKGDVLLFSVRSTQYTAGGGQLHRDYVGSVDAFAVYSPELQSLYLVPISKLKAKAGGSLRLRCSNKKVNNCMFAEDFLYHKFGI